MPSDRQLAILATALLGVVAAIHLFWALGGTWALHAVSGGEIAQPSLGARTFFAVVAAFAIVAAVEALVLGRVVRGPVLRRTVWTAAGLLVLAGAIRMTAAPVVGAAAVVFAFLFAVLAHDAPRAAPARARRRR